MSYCGALVFRETYVDVDGGRALLPVPRELDGKLLVHPSYRQLIRRVHELSATDNFDAYFQRAGMVTGEIEWPWSD